MGPPLTDSSRRRWPASASLSLGDRAFPGPADQSGRHTKSNDDQDYRPVSRDVAFEDKYSSHDH